MRACSIESHLLGLLRINLTKVPGELDGSRRQNACGAVRNAGVLQRIFWGKILLSGEVHWWQRSLTKMSIGATNLIEMAFKVIWSCIKYQEISYFFVYPIHPLFSSQCVWYVPFIVFSLLKKKRTMPGTWRFPPGGSPWAAWRSWMRCQGMRIL